MHSASVGVGWAARYKSLYTTESGPFESEQVFGLLQNKGVDTTVRLNFAGKSFHHLTTLAKAMRSRVSILLQRQLSGETITSGFGSGSEDAARLRENRRAFPETRRRFNCALKL